MLDRLVQILADRATGHDAAQDWVHFNLNGGIDISHFVRGFVALHDTTVTRYQELGEVPLDVTLLVIVGILLAQHLIHELAPLVVEVKAAEALLCFQIGEKGRLTGAVHVDFVKLRELDVEIGGAELMNLLNRAGSLLAELVAGEIEYFKAIGMVFLVECLQLIILVREATTGGCVHNQQHLALVVGK